MKNYEATLLTKDQARAKELTQAMRNIGPSLNDGYIPYSKKALMKDAWQKKCQVIGYPFCNAFDHNDEMTSHFRRVLVELKLLATFGNHNWYYKGKEGHA